jgi:hypothetical protein
MRKNMKFLFPVVQVKWTALFNTATDATSYSKLSGAISFAILARKEMSSKFVG